MAAFPPVLSADPSHLILGSMPGRRSLERTQYYAHPQNSFWYIMSQVCGFDLALDYPKRLESLTDAGYCLWDVLHDCDREGSLDSKIEKYSEVPNNFKTFFEDNPTLKLVGFNGQASRKIFNRHFAWLYQELEHIKWVDLPSTSPAHARLNRSEKYKIWSKQLTP